MGIFNNLYHSVFGQDSQQDAAPAKSYESSGVFEGHDLDEHGRLVTDPLNMEAYEDYLQKKDEYKPNPYYKGGEQHTAYVNPYQLQGIDLLGTEESFWEMSLRKNGLTREDSINIASRLPEVNEALSETNDPVERSQIIGNLMQSEDQELAKCASAYYANPNEFPETVKIGNNYENVRDGRHREISALLAADRAKEEAYANGQPFDPDAFRYPVKVNGEQVAPGQVPVPPQYSNMLPAQQPAKEQQAATQEQPQEASMYQPDMEAVPLDQLPTRTPVPVNQQESDEPDWVKGIEPAFPEPDQYEELSMEPAYQAAPAQDESEAFDPTPTEDYNQGQSAQYQSMFPKQDENQSEEMDPMVAGFSDTLRNYSLSQAESSGQSNSMAQSNEVGF